MIMKQMSIYKESIMEDKFNQNALVFKAISDVNRLLILDYLMEGERCACKILEQLQISQPTLSHHMRILSNIDLVYARKEGKWMHYSLNKAKFEELKKYFEQFTKSHMIKTDCTC